MTVLFLDIYLNIDTWGVYYNPGVASISALLKKHKIESTHKAIFNKKDVKKLIEYIEKNSDIQLIGFTVTEPTVNSVAQISKLIKNKFPNIYIICGGLHCILYPKEVFKKIKCDAVCVGEGEYSTLELIKRITKKAKKKYDIKNLWFRKGNKIIKNPLDKPIEIDALPEPNRDIFYENDLDIYRGDIYLKEKEKGCVTILSRGCYFNCSFCGNWILNKNYHGKYRRILKPNIAINQIKKILKKRHYDYIIFIDAQFPTDEKWLKKFTKLYKEEINIPFTIQIRFGTFNKKTANLLKKAGCYFIQIGLESGSVNLRSNILNKKIDNQLIIDGVKILKQNKIKVGLNNMIGLPEETPTKFIETIKINALLNPDMAYLFIYYPYKGTDLYKYCLKHKLLKRETKRMIFKGENTLKLSSFKEKDIRYYYKYFQDLLYIYKRGLNSEKMGGLFWEKMFKIYSVCPSRRRGIFGLYASITEKTFLENIHL